MSIESLPTRRTGQTIDQDWFNILKRALIVELAPRDSLGVVGPGVADLGDSTNYWENIYASAMCLVANGHVLSLQAPTSLAADTTLVLGVSNYFKSASCGAYSITTTPSVPTNFSGSLTTTGKLVRLSLIDDGSLTASGIVTSSHTLQFQFFRDAVQLTNMSLGVAGTFDMSSIEFIDEPPAGTYTYSIQISTNTGTATINNCRLVAAEM